ncbi:MAG: 50S ribosomal protein L4 [Bacteroidota bacterium]
MELNVHNLEGGETGRTATLDAAVFDVEPNDHVIWLDVRRIQAAARQGTHKAKERAEVSRSTRKLYRQKGTGSARAGSAKSPIRRSGGTIFGPRPRTYTVKVNRKTQRLARRSVLTYKARESQVRLVEDFRFDEPSTKRLKAALHAHDLGATKVLILTNGPDGALHRSSSNLSRVQVRPALEASTLDLITAQIILIQEGALEALSQNLVGRAAASAA